MAHKLTLQGNADLPFIWNISQHVGDSPSCANQATDVLLVKILLGEWIRVAQPSIHPSCQEPFLASAGMNLRVAYWIRAANNTHEIAGTGAMANLSWSENGVLSPAQGSAFGANTWTIVRLNQFLKNRANSVWQNLPSHPLCTGALRAELA